MLNGDGTTVPLGSKLLNMMILDSVNTYLGRKYTISTVWYRLETVWNRLEIAKSKIRHTSLTLKRDGTSVPLGSKLLNMMI